MSTIIAVSVFAGSFALSLALWVFMLRVGLHLARIQNVSIRQIATVTVMTVVLNFICLFSGMYLGLATTPKGLMLILAIICLAPFPLIAWVFKTSFASSLTVWLPTLVSPAVWVAGMLFIVRPFLFESFKGTSNLMAPTLLGPHWEGRCAECGAPAYCTPFKSSHADERLMICRDHFHITAPTESSETVFEPDRFLVARYLKPARWDVIVFRLPAEPSKMYVARLVGLPGEEITIQEDRVWANGTMLTPPELLQEIKYASHLPDSYFEMSGTEDQPANLASDEYFVLGDFTMRSNDSRTWERGAEGHHKFAVPSSHIIGVVTHVCWPLHRLRILR
ncbi:MAG TPA: signal peptidase I [Schlesneria sp.]|jgi:signal peptidase I